MDDSRVRGWAGGGDHAAHCRSLFRDAQADASRVLWHRVLAGIHHHVSCSGVVGRLHEAECRERVSNELHDNGRVGRSLSYGVLGVSPTFLPLTCLEKADHSIAILSSDRLRVYSFTLINELIRQLPD